jgi:hypothetical protein
MWISTMAGSGRRLVKAMLAAMSLVLSAIILGFNME